MIRQTFLPFARTAASAAAVAAAFLFATGSAQPDTGTQNGPRGQASMSVNYSVRHSKSAALGRSTRPERPGPDREAPEVRSTGPAAKAGGGTNTVDPVKQTTFPPATPPVALASFQGITYTGSYPPDTNAAVGDTQVVEVVNSQFAIFDKSGGVVRAATNMYTMFASMTGDDCSWRSGGDPVVQYDKMANRWLIARYLFATNFLCVAVSQTSDATGAYYLYSFSFGPNTADYPKFGVWPDGYYFSANTFAANDGPFMGSQACAFDRFAMLAGLPSAAVICFQGTTAWRSLLPSDLDSALPPPAGSPNYFMHYNGNNLELFRFRPDFGTPTNSTFTGPTVIPVAQFMPGCGACIPQPSTKDKLETLSSRLMYRISYNNFGAYDSLLVTHTVQPQFNGNNPQTAVRWYEIRNPGGTPVVQQQSTFSPDTALYRWLPSIAQDKFGNMLLGYSASSATVFPGVRFTVRRSTDPPNQMQPEILVKAGQGSQTIPPTYSRDRWGDYASVAVDPVDGCTLWFATEYLTATGPSNTWATHLFSAKFSGCN